MADDEVPTSSGDTQMFAIFFLSVLVLFVLPATIWRVFSGGGVSVDVAQPWQKGESRKAPLTSRLYGYVNKVNIVLALCWVAVAVLGCYVSTIQLETEPFNPFTILGVSQQATEKEIKKAYRELSRVWHPDKNKDDPNAESVFVKITKAHQALTDEIAKANWIKYGHPDGPQAMNIGVALPEWFFASDKRTAPLVLLLLVFVGLAIPILTIAYYLYQADGKVGANQVLEETLFMYHKFCVKEMLRVNKMYEAIVPAKEFINIPIQDNQKAAFKELSQTVVRTYDVTRMPKWWTAEVHRTYFFLIAYLDRNTNLVPAALKKDLEETLRIVPIMCEEFVHASVAPRNRFRRGWFMPAEAAVQFQQCVVQQVRPEVLVPSVPEDRRKRKVSSEATAAILQLPGVSEDMVKSLEKPSKIKTLTDLAARSEPDRKEILTNAGVPASVLPDIQKMLMSLPHVHITKVKAFVEEEDDIKEADVLTIQAWVAITRASHGAPGATLDMRRRRAGLQAFTPRYPHPINEKWYVFLTNQRAETPSTWGNQMADFADAEEAGFNNYSKLGCHWAPKASNGSAPAASGTSSASTATAAAVASTATEQSTASTGEDGEAMEEEPIGQKIEFKYLLQEPGKFNLTLAIMPTCWIGCSVSAQIPFTVLKQTALEKAGKGAARGKNKQPVALLDPDEDEDEDGEDEEEGASEEEDWDSDETGTDISHDEEPEEEKVTSSTDKKKQ